MFVCYILVKMPLSHWSITVQQYDCSSIVHYFLKWTITLSEDNVH